MGFLDKTKVFIEDLAGEIRNYLREKYDATQNLFSPASPYGQILEVVQNISQLIFFYIEDSINELNVYTAAKKKSIRGLARLTGHNPTRAISATGQLRLKFNQVAKSEINGNSVILNNWSILKNKNNGLNYLIKLDQDSVKLPINVSKSFDVKIVQGEIEEQVVVSDGTPFQSFNITSSGVIENNHVFVFINGKQATIYESLYSMPPNEYSVMVKTGIGGGIDVITGNGDFGLIPQEGADIKIEYIKTDGDAGVISSNSNGISFEFQDSAVSDLGEEVDLNEVININVKKPIIFGSSGEDIELTRNILGGNNPALVLANDENYVHFLSRFDIFSYIDASVDKSNENINDDNIVNLFLIPDIKKRIDESSDYFNIPVNNFALNQDEKARVSEVISQSGRQLINSEINIVDPIIKKYILNIFLSVFDSVKSIESLKMEIYENIAEYLLQIKRRDKIPKSEIITLLENNVNGIDSVNIQFLSEENERAILNGFYTKTTFKVDPIRQIKEPITKKINLDTGEDPRLGINEFGDIIIGENELPIIRGGWQDRNGQNFNDGLIDDDLSSVNVFVDEIIKTNINTNIRNQRKRQLNNR